MKINSVEAYVEPMIVVEEVLFEAGFQLSENSLEDPEVMDAIGW